MANQNISPNQIKNQRDIRGEKNPNFRCGHLSKELLKDLYWNQKLSTPQCAEKLGIGRTTLIRYLKKFNIRVRTVAESQIGELGSAWKGGSIKKECDFCHKKFEIGRAFSNRGEGKYCSRICMGKGHQGEKAPNWKGGKKSQTIRFYAKIKRDPKLLLRKNISNAIRKALRSKKNHRHWEDLLGYNIQSLKSHLNKTMPKGYSWDDYLKGKLHIDHIIPIAAFNFTSPNDLAFKQCWALSNLRLLPAKENLRKGAKLIQSFQPNLLLAVNQ